MKPQPSEPSRYWRHSLWLVLACLLAWFLITLVPLLLGAINTDATLFGWPWLFAVAAFCVPVLYLLIIGVYALVMDRFDRAAHASRSKQ